MADDVLTAPLVIEYPYTRTVGPALSAFFTGLREKVIVGIRMRDGRVLVPPTEYDPTTSEQLDELVEVGQSGEVRGWAWVHEPRKHQPLDHPFAFGLIRLDGADTDLLHVIDAGSRDAMRTGMRVKVRWRDEREGHIRDIECFEPED